MSGLAVVTALALAGVTGCSGEPQQSASQVEGPSTVTIWDTGMLAKTNEDGTPDMDKSFLDKAAAMFEKEHPNITVKVVQQGGDLSTNGPQFQAASIAGNGPDLRVQFAGGPTLSYADFFEDLSGVFDQKTIDSMTGWNTVREGYKPDGRLLGMPYGGGAYFTVFYNKKVLESAGIDPSITPTSWGELLKNGRTVAEKTKATPFWVANLEGYVGAWVVGGWLGGEMGPSASTDMYNGTTPIKNDAFTRIYQAWKDFGASGLTNPDAGELPNAEATSGFVQGKSAYYISGNWENENLSKAMGDNVGTFFLPMLDGAKYPKIAAGGPNVAISMTNYSKNKEGAAEFLRFLARPEIQDMYVELYQREGSNNKDADLSKITNPLLKAQSEQLLSMDGVVYPFDNVMPQTVIDTFYKVNASVFLGKTTAGEALDQLSTALESAK